MYNRFTVEGYLDKYFQKKVDEFLDFAYSNVANIDTRSINGEVELCIKCPCVKCEVRPYRTRDEVKYHLLQKGFMHGYTTWWEHGETEDTFHHMGQCSNAMEDDEVDAATHMELNNPTDYNLGSSFEEEEVQEEEVPNEFAQRFYGFKDNDVPLYAGCRNWTKLQAATRVLSWKSDLNIPVEALNVIVRDIKSMLPKDNKQVENFYKAKKCSKEISLPIK
ncbi:transposon, En/Spm-like, transposase-associated domain protein, partial [Tanacetum coccineum]